VSLSISVPFVMVSPIEMVDWALITTGEKINNSNIIRFII
jgi:hypothetical protein